MSRFQEPPKENIVAFFKFVQERHNIYLRRQKGQPWPWTDDPILRKYKFCNVYREDDKVTVWIRENWREPYADHRNLWFAMAMARQINWPETLEEIGFPEVWNPAHVEQVLQGRRDRGLKVYTGAYMLTGMLGGGAKGSLPKARQTAYYILDPLYRDPPPVWRAKTLEEAFNMLNGRPGFGPFMSYEVVTDLRHTRYLRYARDIMDWANAGPGAKRGLHRIWNRPHIAEGAKRRIATLSREQTLEEMRYLLDISARGLNPPMEMRDIEHALCEWDKRERIRLGQGVVERYRPPPGTPGYSEELV